MDIGARPRSGRQVAAVGLVENIFLKHFDRSILLGSKGENVVTERVLPAASVIRRARQSDAEALSGFAARLFRDTYSSDTAASDLESYIDKNFSTERQEAEIFDPSAAVFVAMVDDLIIGYAHVVVRSADGRSALLNRIYVDAEWRGSGLASRLLDVVINEFEQRGVTHLELTVFERNSRAVAFYKRVGFAVIGNTTFMVGEDPQTDVVMQLDLIGRLNGRSA
ncbi:GNAT family N-acetyltransferase [Rhizobium leguminosarum bv. viciae]|uniref:GNAT family N-acetyltransferase n=1 Tax=Rhizobium leguminosarum TaxID=384 RepID=UPI00144161E0|nr:GNAT family N-acetyltransferase [Rhizobium leguminosarum]NKL00392.1 GNAT family N-acetyltransferase [Rhizobium leguminosarum bv. viciae]